MQELAPIVLFIYNRPWHTKKTVEALKNNELAGESDLFIFADNTVDNKNIESVDSVRSFVKAIDGFKTVNIMERKTNFGLANNIISGVTEVIDRYSKAIVLEDDIETAPKFLEFMNNALTYYSKSESVFSISGYSLPIKPPQNFSSDIYFSRRSSSWGWATWNDRWWKARWEGELYNKFGLDKDIQNAFNNAGIDLTPMLLKQISGKLDSWAIRWAYTHFLNSAYCLFPLKSLVNNIGTDGSGTNFKMRISKYDVNLDLSDRKIQFRKEIGITEEIERQIRKIVKLGPISRLKNKLRFLIS